jgi:hypothetical protein
MRTDLSHSRLTICRSCSIIDHLLNFVLNCSSQGPVSRPTDFSVYASMNNELQDFIATEVPKRISHTQDSVSSAPACHSACHSAALHGRSTMRFVPQVTQHLRDAEADVQTKLNDLSSLQQQIDNLKAADEAHLAPAEVALHNAQAKVGTHARSRSIARAHAPSLSRFSG